MSFSYRTITAISPFSRTYKPTKARGVPS
jgi:hypothetical protein